MYPKITLTIDVQMDQELHYAYVADLEAKRAGAGRDDRAEYEVLIEAAGEYEYDRSELASMLLSRAGAGHVALGTATPEAPVEASMWDLDN